MADLPGTGQTGLDHEGNAIVTEAAQWLVSEPDHPRPTIPLLRQRFGLSPLQATEAIAEANRLRGLNG